MIHFVIVQFILLSSLNAHAFNCMHRGLQEQVNQITKISWVEEPGELGRRTVEQYAIDKGTTKEAIQDRFAATGLLDCDGEKSTAQLSGDNSTISTVAHAFTDSKSCKKRDVSVRSCTFTVTTSKGKQTVYVSGMVGQGFKCPIKPRDSDDWAVLKLKNPIKGVKPYSLPKRDDGLKKGDKVVSVNAYNNDVFSVNKAGAKKFPKTIEECSDKFDHYDPVEVLYFQSTCDLAGGASGGTILKADSDVLMAIHKGNRDTYADVDAGRDGRSVHKPWAKGQWASYHVLVKGEFLETLRQATGLRE
jgi:hypothetical protein